MDKTTPRLLFSPQCAKYILDAFGKSVDDSGYIVENGERVLTPEGDELELSKFGGIKKGSEIFIKDDLSSVINLAEGKY